MKLRDILFLTAALALTASCSTTRTLPDNEYMLSKNKLKVTNSKDFNTSGLNQYIKQSPNTGILGWTPFVSIYNWVDDDDTSGWARFCRKIGEAPVLYDPDAVITSIDNIKDRLEYLGYYDSKVTSAIHLNKKKARVAYNIALGKRYVIDSVSLELPQGGTFAEDFMEDLANVGVRAGDYLSEASLEQETVRGTEHFRDLGYFDFSKNHYVFEADTVSVPGRTFLEMRINDYTRNETPADAKPIRKFFVDSVRISHNADLMFREDILQSLNTIHPGEQYSASNVDRTYSRLSALKLFGGVSVQMNQVDTNRVNCDISLSSSKLQGFKANLEASTNSTGLIGISPQLSFYNKNLFHGGEWLNLSFLGNFQFMFNEPVSSNEFGVSAGLSLPRFLGLPYSHFRGRNIPRTEINASYNYQNRPEYTRNIVSTSFGYSGNLRRLSYQAYPLQLNIVHLKNVEQYFLEMIEANPFMKYSYQDHFDAGVGGTLYYTTNSEVKPSVSYHYARFTADLSGNLISLLKPVMKKDADGAGLIWGIPFSQYVRGELTLGRTWVFGRNGGQALATRLVGGIGHAYGNSSALPFEKQFYVGGANSMRGWQARSLGPGCEAPSQTFRIPSQTGDLKIEANVEYRFDLFWKLEGALFVDAGNVWSIQQEKSLSSFDFRNLANSIAADWGVGARIDLNFLVLRLDMGMKLHEPSRENPWLKPGEWLKRDGYSVHFGVGYPF